MGRIEAIRNDPRYGFMFENANVGGDTMAAVLSRLFRLEDDGRPITVLRLASLPAKPSMRSCVLSCVLPSNLGFGVTAPYPSWWSARKLIAMPPLIPLWFCARPRSLSRIAKEGRKYGVHLALVSQRPAELDPTIISQCSTLFAMRMSNEQDLALLRTAASDVAAHLLDVVPALGTGK